MSAAVWQATSVLSHSEPRNDREDKMKSNRMWLASGAIAVAAAMTLGACTSGADKQSGEAAPESTNDGKKYTTREVSDGTTDFVIVENPNNGRTLSLAKDSSIKLVEREEDGFTYAFKDMNGTGEIEAWEDWTLPAADRAASLLDEMSIEQIGGLMLFSSHEFAPGDGLTDDQKAYLADGYVRNVLNAGPSVVKDNVTWNNAMQAYVETLAAADNPYIPVNYSSDPRNGGGGKVFFAEEGEMSQWPDNLGMGATFSPETVQQFADMASQEYRAQGIATALSPQIDLASDPRWLRVSGTFGEDAEMTAKMAAAYVNGFQTDMEGIGADEGFGYNSVGTQIKHFPGDGAGEGGRESHTSVGKFAVYPGDNAAEHLIPFEAALDSLGVMTSYSIGVAADGSPEFGVLRGSAYDAEKINILRDEFNWDGVITTDWGVTAGGPTDPEAWVGVAWGVDELTVDERHFEALKAGVDQFGGNNALEPVMAAYDMWQTAYEAGELEQSADDRFKESGQRLVKGMMLLGLWDNPFLELEESQKIVGSSDKIAAGKQAQLNSVVTLKNQNEIIQCGVNDRWSDKVAYIPRSFDTGHDGLFGPGDYTEGPGVDLDLAKQYFKDVVTDEAVTDDDGVVTEYTAPDLSNVDVVIVGMKSPDNGNVFSATGFDPETNEWFPISLQYGEYVADGPNVRQVSIAGEVLEDGTQENRSYYGNAARISNAADLEAFNRAAAAVEASGKDIPIMTILFANNPVIPAEFETNADGIVAAFGVSQQAALEIALGLHESQGRLPIGFPKDMDTVEANFEDVPKDTDNYTDSAGNTYDFGFGLSCDGTPIK